MLKIAYCDDMEQDRKNIFNALAHIEAKWNDKFDIVHFESGEELCKYTLKNHYDIVLLDIQMGGIDGIETATRIRSLNQDTLIIFISSYDDRVKELFSFRTIAFLDKPVDIDKLEEAILRAYEIVKKESEVNFSYAKEGATLYIPIKDIVYFESSRNMVLIHTNNGVESYYGTLASVWEQLAETNEFVMAHRSFIFNLKYVNIKADKVIIKSTGEAFKIGMKHRDKTQERYLYYMEKRWN